MAEGSDEANPTIQALVAEVTDVAEASEAKAKVTAKTFGDRTFITVTAKSED